MDNKTLELILLGLLAIISVIFILLVCVLPALYIMEKEKQRKKIMNGNYPKLWE